MPARTSKWRTARQISLRLRLALWSGGLLLLGSVGLVLFIDLATPKIRPPGTAIIIPRTVTANSSDAQTSIHTVATSIHTVAIGRGEDQTTASTINPSSDPQQITTYQIRLASFLGLGLVIVLGGIGAYWLAGRTLLPVRAVSRAAQQIGPANLDTRLALEGPDDEVRDLAIAFDGMLDRLQRSFGQQERFVADAAHELRTPLATLRTTIDVVRAQPNIAGDQRALTDTFERQLTRIERLVADLLLLAREDAPLIREELIIGVLLDEVVSQLQPIAADCGIALSPATGAIETVVAGDEPLLARVFANLVENALRCGAVMLTVTAEGTWLSVAVADTGIGIPPEDQEHIFDRFFRSDRSRARHRGGAGLGLAIVADVVRRHNGRITLESYLGRGSTFTVTLPH